MIGAGAIDRHITILQATPTKDSTGAPETDWSKATTYATAWAKREDLGGYEYWQARQISGERQTRFRLRHIAGVTEVMRIRDDIDSQVFDIKAVALGPDGTMVLTCEAKV